MAIAEVDAMAPVQFLPGSGTFACCRSKGSTPLEEVDVTVRAAAAGGRGSGNVVLAANLPAWTRHPGAVTQGPWLPLRRSPRAYL